MVSLSDFEHPREIGLLEANALMDLGVPQRPVLKCLNTVRESAPNGCIAPICIRNCFVVRTA